MKEKLGFIGVGQMAGAILTGALDHNVVKANQVGLYDAMPSQLDKFTKQGCVAYENIPKLVEDCDVVFLAVKPQNFKQIAPEIKKTIKEDTLIVSILAGITVDAIQQGIGFPCKTIVVMPNTPLLLGSGATGMGKSPQVTLEEFSNIKEIFSTVGVVEEVEPSLLNHVIPVSGSSPAFIYKFAQITVNKAVENGLSEESALNLFANTLIGSGKMLLETGKSSQQLIDMVTSPGGTTFEGLKALENSGFDKAIQSAYDACIVRAEELAEQNKADE